MQEWIGLLTDTVQYICIFHVGLGNNIFKTIFKANKCMHRNCLV